MTSFLAPSPLFKAAIASLRLAFALVCVGLALILGAHWFGMVPDARVQQETLKQKLCESISIGVLDDIRQGRWIKLQSTLEIFVQQNEALLSAGVRTDTGQLLTETSEHRFCCSQSRLADGNPAKRAMSNHDAATDDPNVPIWARNDAAHSEPHSETDNESKITRTSVPITVSGQPLGDLEFCFRATSKGILGGAIDPNLLRLLAFFSVIGLGSYSILMMRIMGVFSRTQVVPDGVRHALNTLAEGILILDEKGDIVLANDNFLNINGYESSELQSESASELPWIFSIGDDGPREWHALVAPSPQSFPWVRAIEQRESVAGEIMRLTGRDGVLRVFAVNAAPIGNDKEGRGALVTFQDVTHVEKHRVELENMLSMLRMSKDEIQKKNQELEVLATRDALTGCLNRRAFFETMTDLFKEHQQKDIPLSCFMVDVDHFKSVNDTYGHHTGDEVLREVSRVLLELHEEKQIVCRYGGEEFCVMMPGLSLDEAMIEAECTRMAIMQIRLVDPASLRLTASLGVSELKFDAADPQELINQADTCLYVAKRGGRNQSVQYDPERIADMGEEVAEAIDRHVDPDLVSLPFHAVTALVSALAYRDVATAEHSRRVANLCITASRGLMCQRETYILEIAALLHDIGKIGVPDDVLHKAGPLTESEWTVMHRHNEIGLDMVAGTFHCPELETTIRCHHDIQSRRIPKGDVPVGAKLLSIADTYDALITDHSYRQGRSPAEAIAELRRCVGSQFDGDLVEHFVETVCKEQQHNIIGMPTTQGIAFAIPKPTALKIGQQIERLCEAMDSQDQEALKKLSRELGTIAEDNYLMPIVDAANQIDAAMDADEDVEWTDVLRQTQTLLDLCRATQNAHLVDV
ncbi:MAG: diguanylate cyclase [Planctomycetota bacterium]